MTGSDTEGTVAFVIAGIQDSAGTVVTLTSSGTYSVSTKCAIQVVRSGTAVTLKVNGATVASGTVADLDGKAPGGKLYIGENNSGNEFDGVIDFVRGFKIALPDQRFGYIRFPYPMDEAVLFDYEMEAFITAYCQDRSRFQNHALIVGTMTSATALCEASMPVFGMTTWVDRNATARIFVAAGNTITMSELRS
jgi:hypothetical protein